MKTIKNSGYLKHGPCVIAIGTFDGVHLGHRHVISAAVEFAKKKKLPSVVVTFDPHPQSLVHSDRNVKLLTTVEERACLIAEVKADILYVARFSKKLRSMSYSDFARRVIRGKLNASHVFVGRDYTFGKNREGNLARLRKLGLKLGFGVTGVKDKIEHRRVVKSTLIRSLISNGGFAHAIKLLGHPYLICGKVVKGRGIGRKIGYPTANIEVSGTKLVPKLGVYACRVILGSKKLKGAVNIGKKPTFSGTKTTIEVYIFNFNNQIAGKKVCLLLEKRLRDEKKFDTVEELVKAIKHDVSVAKDFLV